VPGESLDAKARMQGDPARAEGLEFPGEVKVDGLTDMPAEADLETHASGFRDGDHCSREIQQMTGVLEQSRATASLDDFVDRAAAIEIKIGISVRTKTLDGLDQK